jgi:hypothetical protein
MVRQNTDYVKHKIDHFEATDEKFSSRSGLRLLSRYIQAIGITSILSDRFSFLKKSSKGTPLWSIFHQLLLFFIDGTDLHMRYLDQLKKDPSYAGTIETEEEKLLSSHSAKRFFSSVYHLRVWLFRKILQQLFVWRLNIERPEIIKIGLDTMVLDNDDSKMKEGVEPTYKKVKGFQPLQPFWGRYMIGAIFRNGKAHSNHGNHVQRVVTHTVHLIRTHYRKDVPIIFLADAGFLDEEFLRLCEQELQVGIILGGKMYSDLTERVEQMPDEAFSEYTKGRKSWIYTEFEDSRKSWSTSWSTIYTKPISDDDGQIVFEYARPETVIYTNIGMNNTVTASILKLHQEEEVGEISPQAIINDYHMRARDELVNRALKDFGTEYLPFKRFTSNAAYYYLMAIAFFIFEAFKKDAGSKAVEITWYAQTFRRKFLDFAGQIVCSGRRLKIKINTALIERLDFSRIWENSVAAPPIAVLAIQ